jgi:hypothetical protein
LYGPATYEDPTPGFVWGGKLADAVFDGANLYVFSGQADNASSENATRVVKLPISSDLVAGQADLSRAAVPLALQPPANTTIDYVSADLTSNGDLVVGFRAIAPACTSTSCPTGCSVTGQTGPRLAMYDILYAGESAFRPAQALRPQMGSCGNAPKRIDYVSVQADPPSGILGGNAVWVSLEDEQGRLVGTVVP